MSSFGPHTHKDSLPSEVEPHDMMNSSHVDLTAITVDGCLTESTVLCALETQVANGLLRKLRNQFGEITYIEYAKGVCGKCVVVFDIAHPEIAMTFCESCNAFQDTEEARARFLQRV